MPIDASIYQQIKPFEMPSYADSQAKAMTLSNMGLQQKQAMQQMDRSQKDGEIKDKEAAYAEFGRKRSMLGNAFKQLVSLPDEEAANLYPQVRQSLIDSGVISENDARPDYDRSFVHNGYKMFQQSEEGMKQERFGLEGRKTEAEIAKLYAEAAKARREGTGTMPLMKQPFHVALQKASAEKFEKDQATGQAADQTISQLDDAYNSLANYTKNSSFGTGPVASLGGWMSSFSTDAENLDRKFGNLALKNMQTMFAGMSKSIDSDAEKAFFQATQPSIKNRESTNASIILGAKSLALKQKAEAEAQKSYLEQSPTGDMTGYRSPVLGNVTALIDEDGQMRLVPNKQVAEFLKQGFSGVDEYAKGFVEREKPSRSQMMAHAADKKRKAAVPAGDFRQSGSKVSADEVGQYATKHNMRASDAKEYLKGLGYAVD